MLFVIASLKYQGAKLYMTYQRTQVQIGLHCKISCLMLRCSATMVDFLPTHHKLPAFGDFSTTVIELPGTFSN